MSYQYEATTDFFSSITEVDTLIELAEQDNSNRSLFLKLAVVSLVTKFQVFVETILEEFRYRLNNKPSRALSTYLLMNSLRLSLSENNALIGITKHHNYSDDKKDKIISYLNSISYFSDNNQPINDDFNFYTKFPLGKTGKNELVNLLKQIDGNDKPFESFGEDEFGKLDSLLQTRHLIIHRDRFYGTDGSIKENSSFVKKLVEYIDDYLSDRISEIEERAVQTTAH